MEKVSVDRELGVLQAKLDAALNRVEALEAAIGKGRDKRQNLLERVAGLETRVKLIYAGILGAAGAGGAGIGVALGTM